MIAESEPPIAGRYELLEVIGRGGSSTVHRARDLRLGTSVAVKVVPSHDSESDRRRRRREAAMLPSLRHPALVPVLDQHVEEDRTFLVMELLGDGTLRDRLRRGPLRPADVAAVGADVAAGLDHIHGRGIVHRDVKPGNVMLVEGVPLAAKLTDFGIASLQDATTTTAGVIGTALYLSPEQAHGRPLAPSSDVYSLGLTLLEALTGRPAFPGSVAESVTARLLRDPTTPPGFGYGWRSLIGAMTARDPDARPTAAEVERRLRSIADAEVVVETAELLTLPIVLPAVVAAAEAVPTTRPARVGLVTASVALAAAVATGVALLVGAPASGGADPAVAAPASAGPTASPAPSASTAPRPVPSTAATTAPSAAAVVPAVAVSHTTARTRTDDDRPEARTPSAKRSEPDDRRAPGEHGRDRGRAEAAPGQREHHGHEHTGRGRG